MGNSSHWTRVYRLPLENSSGLVLTDGKHEREYRREGAASLAVTQPPELDPNKTGHHGLKTEKP